ncbi:contactin-associated protein-like 5 isoform X1 [Dunckerocampus dactyliophorus]|uniref:contactin-associated protein-like 5 isoform X1 n=1 Tax=Dunckerocampus dactyliophorus TaxID=161453 RepID=UPI00240556BF|nr:contactin-associated protein-like 5 isoform X1 [Dunckerocampus dactyliophorus]
MRCLSSSPRIAVTSPRHSVGISSVARRERAGETRRQTAGKMLALAFCVTFCAFCGASAANNYNCNAPLVSTLPRSSFQSSSQSSAGYAAHNAKLHKRDEAGGWSAAASDKEPWLQLDLREQMEVTAVATQGCYDSWDWVSAYLLLYSDTGRVWRRYRHDDGTERFVGNVNSEGVVQNKLSHSMRARYLRFVPLDWNPSGWIGLRVEVYGCSYKSYVADFDGRSSLLYRFNQKSMSTVKDVISLLFKSQRADGVLLHGEGQRGDYITLELHRGKLDLYLNLDDSRPRSSSLSRVAVTVGSLLDDRHWHAVHVERFNKHVNLTLDSHTHHFQTHGEAHSLEVDYELSFGGIPLPGKPGTFLRKNFHGCMENLYYNGINIIDLAKRRKPQIHSVGNVTFSCSQPQMAACTFLSANSSFLTLPSAAAAGAAAPGGFSARFQFRTWNPKGLLLSVPLGPGPQRAQLQIQKRRLHLTLHASGRKSEVSPDYTVNDGLWHSVSLEARNFLISLTVDSEPSSQIEVSAAPLQSRGTFHFGGCPTTDCQSSSPAFQGCMQLISIDGQPVNLSHVQQGMLGTFSHLHYDTCAITDRCVPNQCEHGGLCSQTWTSFSCDCSGTGYSGATCHDSIYESSCEAYKLIGGSSGFYSVDADGSGPLGATQVYCNMTEEKVWTVLAHNSTAPVRVQASALQVPHTMVLDYGASAEQLQAIVTRSEHCQQEVVYNCKRSRLFNTKDGSPLSWWLDRHGEKRSYWGGFLPGIQQCSCSLAENCADMNYFCNCDADADSWTNDTGVLSFRDHLPVSQVVIGDIGRAGSQAVYHVGPLRCYGDRSMWNAATFYQESSYLYFPTSPGEPASDISFYFKTSAPSGVFVESLGLKDFVRVELSSPSTVSFSFDVGSGAALLSVKSHLPLNDRQWHHVRADHNVKEASLQVDQLPARFLAAPADQQLPLKLSSQLFVGGTTSLQRGFLGCVRSLLVNGRGLDLEERAKMTPGVSAGCPGYCSGSSSLCHNRGRCIEKSNGYVCDCSQSAYAGTSCNQEVSVSFDKESSLTYTLQEPFSVMLNKSSRAESSRAREDVSFSFITSRCPAMLLSVSTLSRQYIAVILARNGSLQIWYHLQTDRKPDVLRPTSANLADGRLHRVRIHRVEDKVYVQLDQDIHRKYTLSSDGEPVLMRTLTLGKVVGWEAFSGEVTEAASDGFVGCLSLVQFNNVALLKAALTNPGSSLVSVRGPLVQSNCGALADSSSRSLQDQTVTANNGKEQRDTRNDVAVIAGVVAAAVFIGSCALAATARLLYQRQRARTSEVKREDAASAGGAGGVYMDYRTDMRPHASVRDNMKEYYI